MSTISLSFALVLLHAPTAHAWCWPGCHGHGTWSWWGASCACNSGREGACCETPQFCAAGMDELCPQQKMIEHTASCSAVGKSGPISIGTAPLPKQLRGVFWLAEQGDSSALMSFAKSNDGKRYSSGALDATAQYDYEIRVGGDRVWSFHDKATSWGLVEAIDLIYKFDFDSATDPKSGQIIPSGENLGGFDLNAPWLLNFAMTLLPEGSHPTYSNSTVWGRPSAVLGFSGGYYDLIQIMDENGDRLEPAFSDWVSYCNSAETGSTPDQIHYRKAVAQ